jgi:hypothetical protein
MQPVMRVLTSKVACFSDFSFVPSLLHRLPVVISNARRVRGAAGRV